MIKTKKFLLVILLSLYFLLATINVSFASVSRLTDLRLLAMGSASVALKGENGSFIRNPASLYQNDHSLFRVGMRYSELIKTTVDSSDPIAWIQKPTAAFELLFSSRYLALSIGLNNILEGREVAANNLNFRAINDSRIQITTSYGWRGLSIGLYAQGGNRTYRDIEIRKNSYFRDYISRTYLERYTRQMENSQYFQSALGLLYSYRWVSVGLLTDSLVSLDYETNEISFDFVELWDKSSFGIALSTPEFNIDNELNRLVFNFGADFTNLGSADTRSFNLGIEGKIQFTNSLSVALRGGYHELRTKDKAFFNFEGNGVATFGLGTVFGNGALDITVEYPIAQKSVIVSAALTWGL